MKRIKHRNKTSLIGILLLAFFAMSDGFSELHAALWLPRSLSDHILFQQDEPVVLWGKAAPNSEVTAEITGENTSERIETARAIADSNGRWRISLKPLKASFKKYSIKISGDGDTRFIHDALVGELWLSGGQSNMDVPLRYIIGGRELMAAAWCDGIRIFYQKVADESWWKSVPETPVDDTVNGRWLPAYGTNVAECSGVAYTFASALYDALNKDGKEVPVGIINTAVGATGVADWMSRTAIESDSELKSKLPAKWNVGDWKQYYQPWGQATALFNLKIAPLTSHAVRGFIWYQGENDAGFGKRGAEFYKKALTALIADWRYQWGGKARPFILTQLHAWDDGGKMPVEQLETYAYMREAQFDVAQAVPETAAVAIHDVQLTWNTGDFGYKCNCHPLDKRPVGERMALAARALAYGESVEYGGPVFDRMEILGEKAVLHFHHSQGLKVGGNGRLLGFAICGEDRRFAEAEAHIVGETVEVANSQVRNPVAVTYGFTSMNHCANLFNGNDLPAYPFRTDKVNSAYLKGCTAAEAEAAVDRLSQNTTNLAGSKH